MTVSLFLKESELANRCNHKSQCTPLLIAVWCVALISWTWMRSYGVTSALNSARFRVFCSRNIRTSSVFYPLRVRTSSSACRHSSALKRNITLRLLGFHPVRYATFSSSSVTFFSSLLAKVSAFSRLDVVKFFARLSCHTGMRKFFIVVVAGNGNL